MKEALVTRSFVTTVVNVKGQEETMRFPNMHKQQVLLILSVQKLEVESISEEIVQYGMSESTFLENASPIIKKVKDKDTGVLD